MKLLLILGLFTLLFGMEADPANECLAKFKELNEIREGVGLNGLRLEHFIGSKKDFHGCVRALNYLLDLDREKALLIKPIECIDKNVFKVSHQNALAMFALSILGVHSNPAMNVVAEEIDVGGFLLHYFKATQNDYPILVSKFTYKYDDFLDFPPTFPKFDCSPAKKPKLHLPIAVTFTSMQTADFGQLFSNKRLDHRYIMQHPDLTALPLLFKEPIQQNEAFYAEGFQMYTNNEGDYFNNGKPLRVVFANPQDYSADQWAQYSAEEFDKELFKISAAFSAIPGKNQAIQSGAWGCGPFLKGDVFVKVLMQFLAAARTGHSIDFRLPTESPFAVESLHSMLAKLKKYQPILVYKAVREFLPTCREKQKPFARLGQLFFDHLDVVSTQSNDNDAELALSDDDFGAIVDKLSVAALTSSK